MSNCTLIDVHGNHRVEWMLSIFGECVHTSMEKASFYVGLSSIGFWLLANFPQIYENYRNSNASSLHLAFLIQWILGDSLNLIGAVLTGQLTTQIITAIYYMCMDAILITQWVFYTTRDQMRKRAAAEATILENGEADPQTTTTTTHTIEEESEKSSLLRSALWIVVILVLFGLLCVTLIPQDNQNRSSSLLSLDQSQNSNSFHLNQGRRLLSTNYDFDEYSSSSGNIILGEGEEPAGEDDGWPPKGFQAIFGYSVGCASAALYLGSRIPQIFKNFQRKSTEGLSLMLFFCAFMGNVTYSVSIFLFSTRGTFILSKLPWIIGSAGVLCMDFTILMQFLFFNVILKKKPVDEEGVGEYYVPQIDDKEVYVGRNSATLINE